MPRVSIVVIVYNDAEHLPAALRSAQAQTFRDLEIVVVDDASTDGTAGVIAGFAAEDARVKPLRLDINSGGCSRPRNAGLDIATGDYVLFLDSDDVLPRRSVSRLYDAAVRADADIACGRLVRRHHSPRRHLPANDELYRKPAVLDGVLARPDQLRDTPACGKLFRRSFLEAEHLRFPEGRLFEDLLFTTTAYAAAERIAIVPHLVYVWNVRRDQAVPSITNRRELRNWRDRFEIHRRIDGNLATRPQAQALRAAKDVKFLTVDWPLFLRELRLFPAGERPALLDLAADYVNGVALTQRLDVAPGLRAACFLAGRRDLDATLTAADFVTTGGVGTDLVVDGDRLFWTAAHLDAPGGRDALDVTATGLLHASFASTPFLAVVSEARLAEGAAGAATHLELAGRVHDVLGRLADTQPTARVRVSGRFGGVLLEAAADLSPHPDGLAFRVDVDLAALGRRLQPAVGHELRLDLLLRARDAAVCRVPLTARDAQLPADRLPVAGRWQLVLGSSAGLLERNGRLVLALPDLHPRVDAALDLASRGRSVLRRRIRTQPRPHR